MFHKTSYKEKLYTCCNVVIVNSIGIYGTIYDVNTWSLENGYSSMPHYKSFSFGLCFFYTVFNSYGCTEHCNILVK